MEEQLDLHPDLKIKEIAEKARDVEKTVGGPMSPGEKKRGRGRPPKATPDRSQATPGVATPGAAPGAATPGQMISSKRIAEPFVKLVSKAGGVYAGDARAEMTPKELEDVAESLGLVLDKWMPLISSNYGPELLLATTMGAYGLRVMAIKKVLEQEKALAKEKLDFSKPLSEQIGLKQDLPTQAPGQYDSPSLSV